MPYSKAIHGDELGLATYAVLGIVISYEIGERQAIFFNYWEWDAAIPPCGVSLARALYNFRNGEYLVIDKILELSKTEGWLCGLAGTHFGHEPSVLPLLLADLHVEHSSGDHGLGVLVIDDAQQVVGALDALGGDGDVVIHE